jgi:RNA polymerase sigma factor (sigma-70 family)
VISISNKNQHRMTAAQLSNLDEHGLLIQIAAGNQVAFELFYKIYYPRLFSFILRVTRRMEVVEELIQETLLVVWDKPDNYNETSKVSTWVFGIAYLKSLKLISRLSQYKDEQDIDEVADRISDPGYNLHENQERIDLLNNAMAILSFEQRAVIELTFYHGLPYQDVARILNCPENTVKTRMFHARKKLQSFAKTQEC